MTTVRTVQPAHEPITLDECKLSLRVDHAADDDLIEQLITAARIQCENEIEGTLSASTWVCALDQFPDAEITLEMGPITAVTSVQYIDTTGTLQTLSTSAYDVDLLSRVGRIVPLTEWPETHPDKLHTVRVTYTAGYAVDHGHGPPINDVPMPLRRWCILAVGDMYRNRERSSERPSVSQGFADGLLDAYRLTRV